MMLSGCTDKKNDSANGTTTTTTAPISSSSVTEESFHGEYEADDEGQVADSSDDISETMPETLPGDETVSSSDVTDDGIVGSTSVSDLSDKNDEAAFASSYIDKVSRELSEKKIGWGLGREHDDKNRPLDAVQAEKKYSDLGARFLAADGRICLTFDEGYENGYTAQILDTLAEKNVKAVFFVTYDYCKSSPELVRRMIDEGHTVGNHTYTHPSMPDCTQKQVWEEVTKLHDHVRDNFGYEMTLFRFPMGEFSERCLDDLKNLGYTSVFWSFAYKDWDVNSQPDEAQSLEKLKSSTHSGIYLLHAVSSVNAHILPDIIDYWTQQGFSVGSEI